jgi:hypothetical protein
VVPELPPIDPGDVPLMVAMVAGWAFVYMAIGGRWPKPLLSGPLTAGMRARAAIATLLLGAILVAGALRGIWTIPPIRP